MSAQRRPHQPRQPRHPRPPSQPRVVSTPKLPKPAPKPAPTPAKPARPPKATRAASAEKLSPDVLQLALDQAMRDLGLPTPTAEYEFAKDIKRRWRIDRAWAEPLMIALEIEGGIHMRGRHIRPAGFLADMDKYNELALRGWLLVRISYDMIADGRALALITRAHAARAAHAA